MSVKDFNDDDLVAVKIKGLPFKVRFYEISDFFADYNFIDKSVVLGVNKGDGRKNGFGAIPFDSQDDAEKAIKELNGEYLGERYLQLSLISYGDYTMFNGPNGGAGFGGGGGGFGGEQGNTVKLSQNVGMDNKDRALICRGCPWKITPEEIVGFFEGFGTLTKEDVFIEEFRGKRTGSALVIFENETVAQEAKEAKNKEKIGEE